MTLFGAMAEGEEVDTESGQKQWKAENDPKVEELNTTREDLLNQLDSLSNNNNERGIVLHQQLLRLCNESLKKQREERQAWETNVKTAKTIGSDVSTTGRQPSIPYPYPLLSRSLTRDG